MRYGFSAPVQSLARYGFLDGRHSVFDYGCGWGDDVRGLRENGLTASGWDPYFAPEKDIEPADIVNLGFVVNVIEDFDERLEALTRAFSLAERLLVVSVMLANQNDVQGQRFRDGTLTKRGTFQKYYTQAEIKSFLEQVLDEEPIPVALNQFERRKPYKHFERALQRDIKDFFGDYRAAQTAGLALLMQIADVDCIGEACRRAAEHGLGWLEQSDEYPRPFAAGEPLPRKARVPGAAKSLQLHVGLVEQLPALLRVYVGCAAVLYGDYRNADLVKVHIGSGKLSLMRYDDFEGKALPRMAERVKIKLREQDIDYFAYGDEYEPPFLYLKSRFINEEFPNYPEQVAFEETLQELGLFDFSGYGPRPGELLETLAERRLVIDGFELARAMSTPDLDEPCGRYLAFRQLIACGETQRKTGLSNLPKRPESYNALHDLAVQVLDPVIDYFGMIRLTYGFCSPELAKQIPGRIDPKRDQHGAHERNRLGNPVCPRLGAAVDFIVEDESMLEVAQWVVANTPFDRLYFYGDDLPLHVSFGPDHSRQVVRMVAGESGRLIPRVTPTEAFLALREGGGEG